MIGDDHVMTRVVANVSRHETVTYVFEGAVDVPGAVAMIASGEYDPMDSQINHEEIDVTTITRAVR